MIGIIFMLSVIIALCIWKFVIAKIHTKMLPEQLLASKDFFNSVMPYMVAYWVIIVICVLILFIHFL